MVIDPQNFLIYAKNRLQVSKHEVTDTPFLRVYYIVTDGIDSVFMSEVSIDGITDTKYETDHDRLLANQWVNKGTCFVNLKKKIEVKMLLQSKINDQDEDQFR